MSKHKGKMVKKQIPEEMTVNVKNGQLESLLKQYTAENTAENLGKLVTCIHHSRVLIPATLNEKKQPVPCLIKNTNGGTFMPVYTSKGQIPQDAKSPGILNMPYIAINHMALTPELQTAGIVINPFSDNLIFKPELLQRIEETEQKLRQQKQAGVQKKTVQLTEEQYLVFERNQFEFRFLPGCLFREGGAFIEELCGKKEEYIDRLYEESYQQKRMYPYLPEEFSVMIMNISEELLMASIDLPARDMGANSCLRIYIAWNGQEQKGRYFTIERGREHPVLGELTSNGKHIDHGEAPAEGAQLQKVIDLIEDERRHTS